MVFKHYTNDVLKDMHSTTYCNDPGHASTIFDHSTITFILLINPQGVLICQTFHLHSK
eukprot:12445.XXX_624320_624493_1 [CDS] Oithona nana genome sequencing.